MIRNSASSLEPTAFLKRIFRWIDKEIEDTDQKSEKSADEFSLIKGITSLYWETWTGLKHIMGTSAGWAWFGEYMVFRLIRRILERLFPSHEFRIMNVDGELEKRFGTKRELRRKVGTTKDVWVYGLYKKVQKDTENFDLILAHNANLPEKGGYRTDVCVLDSELKPLVVVEAKNLLTDSHTLPAALKRLARVSDDESCLRYLVALECDGNSDETDTRKTEDKLNGTQWAVVAVPGGKLEKSIRNIIKKGENPIMPLRECLDRIGSKTKEAISS